MAIVLKNHGFYGTMTAHNSNQSGMLIAPTAVGFEAAHVHTTCARAVGSDARCAAHSECRNECH